jgi:hypothetical protein
LRLYVYLSKLCRQVWDVFLPFTLQVSVDVKGIGSLEKSLELYVQVCLCPSPSPHNIHCLLWQGRIAL